MDIPAYNKKIHETALWLATNHADKIQLEAEARSLEELSHELLEQSKDLAKRAKECRKRAQESTNFDVLEPEEKDNG